MAMSELVVTAAQLKTKAQELQQLNQTFKAKVDALEETETALSGMWEGDAKEAFHKAFSNDKIQMTNFFNAIAQYVSVMEQIAAKYQEAEARNVQTANSRNY